MKTLDESFLPPMFFAYTTRIAGRANVSWYKLKCILRTARRVFVNWPLRALISHIHYRSTLRTR